MKIDYIKNQTTVIVAKNKVKLTNIYMMVNYQLPTTSIEKKHWNAYTYRNIYSSSDFLKLLDRKDWKQVNPDSGKTWQARNCCTVWK